MVRFVLQFVIVMSLLIEVSAQGYRADLDNKLKAITGTEVVDCGVLTESSQQKALEIAYECIVRAKLDKKVVRFILALRDEPNNATFRGFVSDKERNVYLFSYDNSDLALSTTQPFKMELCDALCLGNYFDGAIALSKRPMRTVSAP